MTGAMLSMLVVMLGAFGAHGLKTLVSSQILDVYQTGIQYQMFHSIAILLLGIVASLQAPDVSLPSSRYLLFSYRLFLLGIMLFCGSLYGLAFSEAITGHRFAPLGMITPFGGLSFIAGWFCLFMAFWKK
jgi:uncharacterized membrane protein YgdD (TMEM256/DUF423 family)